MKRTIWVVLGLALMVAALLAWRSARGPVLEAYLLQAQPLVQTVVATGRVSNVSRVQVGSEVPGVVLERRVEEGDRVAAGDLLAVVRADDLEAQLRQAEARLAQLQQSSRPQAQAALRQAETQLTQAQRETARRQTLLQQQLIARETYEQAAQAEAVARAAAEQARLAARSLAAGNPDDVQAREQVAAARAALEKTKIRAQSAGVVLTRNAEPGDLVQPGTVLFELASDGPTELRVPLDEKNLQVLAVGQPAQCVADAFPDRPFPATVKFIAPSVDTQRGSVDVRLEVSPVPDYLRQDMTVSVNIETGRREQALVVPNDALTGVGNEGHSLWVVRDGRARLVRVELGLRGTAASEIVSGVQAGEQVLAAPPEGLKDGDRVRTSLASVPQTAPTADASRNQPPVALD